METKQARRQLAGVRRIVVKLGTYLLTGDQTCLDTALIEKIVEQAVALRRKGLELILVTSGAVGAGVLELGLRQRPSDIPMLQAAAAVGQTALMHLYRSLFRERGFSVGQILLTREDIDHRQRHLNARYTVETLLQQGVVPIVNENDTVTVESLKFYDNDYLAAQLANLVRADLLIVLTDVDGLLEPREGPRKEWARVPVVKKVTPAIMEMAGGSAKEHSRGGMRSKLEAARMVARAGGLAVIANGRRPRVLSDIVEGEDVGTLFLSPFSQVRRRKCWIAFARVRRGWLTVDDGARRALAERGKSLLASGITAVEGVFGPGDMVGLRTEDGLEFARGLVNYSAEDVGLIKGKQTSQIGEVLGGYAYDEVVHRDNLLVL
ncbi:MAG TPA: glutamate 5-kinase [bacterium]|nr:glutamate 5-kinase [bacterium]HPQ66797.1 glutamate 5-kinase [bacterium]